MTFSDTINSRVANSPFGRHFQLEGSGAKKERPNSKFLTELRGGLATFVAMAYIISVNSTIIADSGGPCICNPPEGATGNDALCVGNSEYESCKLIVRQDLITATCAIACLASALMGTFANLPMGMAPGMGLNAYFAYTVVGFNGSGKISYQVAIAAVFLEGLIFLFMSVFGIRQYLARLIPVSIKIATGAGIGLYLCFIGLQSSAGIGLITADASTLVTLGGCDSQYKDENGVCLAHHMESGRTWLGIMGIYLMTMMSLFQVKGSILICILIVAIISWPRNTTVTFFPYTPEGQAAFDFFKQVVTFHPIQKTLAVLHFDLSSSEIWIALITLLYVDIMDTTGTLYSMAKFGGYMDGRGDFEGSSVAFICDSLCVSIGALFGTSPCTTFVESGAGITEGARTGIAGLTVSFGFFISLFFAPIFASFPPWSTGPALVLVGSMMIQNVINVNWGYMGDAVPSFLTMALMPLTYSIADGMIGGLCTYIVINISVWLIEKASFGRLTVDKTQKEPWSGHYLSGSGILPPWIKRIAAKVTGRVPGDDLPKNGVYEMGNVRNSDQETRVSLSSQDDDIITVASAK
ncbi:permease family-domain-containing protein [Umbelopsis sp. PMI_123]|nr:permease family-domain-containing protein [Umbelopsis sp. PMI_123]